MGQGATTPSAEGTFPVLFARGMVRLYVQLMRERSALVKDAVNKYVGGIVSASALVREIAALDDYGLDKIGAEAVNLLRRLVPRSASSASDAALQWVVWPDAGSAAEWAAHLALITDPLEATGSPGGSTGSRDGNAQGTSQIAETIRQGGSLDAGIGGPAIAEPEAGSVKPAVSHVLTADVLVEKMQRREMTSEDALNELSRHSHAYAADDLIVIARESPYAQVKSEAFRLLAERDAKP